MKTVNPTKKSKRLLPILCAFGANVIFGLAFLFTKTALTVSSSVRIVAGRFTVAFLVLTVLILCRVIKVKYRREDLLLIAVLALCQPFLYFLCETVALESVSSALAGVIDALIPVFVMLLSFPVNREKPTALQIVAVLLSVGGVVAINLFADAGENRPFGVFLMVMAAVCATGFNLFSRKLPEHVTPFEKTYAMFGIASVGFHLCGFVTEGANYLPSLMADFTRANYLLPVLFLGTVCSIGAFSLYNYAIAHADAVTCSFFAGVATVVTVLSGSFILHENFSPWQLVLCLPVVAGVVLISTGGKEG